MLEVLPSASRMSLKKDIRPCGISPQMVVMTDITKWCGEESFRQIRKKRFTLEKLKVKTQVLAATTVHGAT